MTEIAPEVGPRDPLWHTEDGRLLRVARRTVRRPGGVPYWQHEVVVNGGAHGVVIVPVHQGAIAFVHLFRPLVGKFVFELPRGFGEADDALRDAARELREETGYVAGRLVRAGAFVLDTGLVPTVIDVVIAEIVDQATAGPLDDEVTGLRWTNDVDALLSHQTPDAITLAALALARAKHPTLLGASPG